VIYNRKEFNRLKAWLRDTILHDARLTRTEQRIGSEIADYLNYETGDAWPSQEVIARRANCSVKSVERATKLLAGTEKIDGLWFTREIDAAGGSYRYIPKFDRLTQMSTRQNVGYRHPTFATETPDIQDQETRHNVGLSSLREPNRDPTRVCGQPGGSSPVRSEQTVERGVKDAISFGGRDEEITAAAVAGGARWFVWQGSEPWRAWNEYRERNGIPGPMPTRQHVVKGCWRTGWDVPTLWPPGYQSSKLHRRS
jgi:hypothetical protein